MAYYPRPVDFGAHYTMYSAETGITATFNNPFDPNYAGMLTEVTGLDSPEVRENAEDLVESDGGVHGNFYYGRRPIMMSGKIFGHINAIERAQRSDKIRSASQAMRTNGKLSWVPAERTENVIFNPRMAVDTSYWSKFDSNLTSTWARVTGQSAPGFPVTTTANEITITTTGAANPQNLMYQGPQTVTSADGGSVYAGQEVTDLRYQYVHAQAAIQMVSISAGAAPEVRVRVRCLSSTNAYLGSITAKSQFMSTGGYTVLSGTVPTSSLPAGTARIGLEVAVLPPTLQTATYVVRVTNAMLHLRWDNQTPQFIDGSKIGGYWHAAPDAGPSGDFVPMGLSFRRQQPYRETGPWVKDFQVALVSEDPYILSPYLRASTLPLGSSVSLTNQGNARYYPTVLIKGSSESGAYISDGAGGVVYLALDLTNGAGVDSLLLDTLTHDGTEYIGTSGPAGPFIDWLNTLSWPSIAPQGSSWSFINGPGGALTNAVATINARDAWV